MTTAAWIPGWYELAPQLEVGLSDEFAFWRIVPEHICCSERLVIYNSLWHPENALVGYGTIASIRHPELGAILKVDTRGLDYTITLIDGAELRVDAEEQPGKLEDPSRVVTDWLFLVDFDNLSELRRAI